MLNPNDSVTAQRHQLPVERFRQILNEYAKQWGKRFANLEIFTTVESLAEFMPPSLLVLRVRSRLNSGSSWDALHFRTEGEDIYVAGGGRIGDTPEFRDHLGYIDQAGHLSASLEILNSEAKTPMEGVLRTLDPTTLGANDVAVRLTEEDLQRLERSQKREIVTVYLTDPPRFAPLELEGGPVYQFLTVHGAIWHIAGEPKRGPDRTSVKLVVEPYDDGTTGFI